MTKKELQELATSKNIHFAKSDTKQQLLDAIAKHDKPFFPASMSARPSRYS